VIFLYKLISHRGVYSKINKENTYEAIKLALKSSKYVGVEFDVRETKDCELVVFHDALYNNKLVSDTFYKDLPKYVPRLNDILKINSNKIFLIEIKNISNYQKMVNLINKYDTRKIYVMSFSNKIVNKLNIDNRKYKIGVLNYVLNTSDLIKELDFVGILNSLLNNDVISKLKGKEIFSYGLFKKKKYKEVYYIVDE